MRIVNRYIFAELASIFSLVLLVFTFILLLGQIANLIDLVLSKGVSLLVVAELLVLILPPFLVVTIPTSLLVACVMTFSRLSADGEILALKANGFSLYRLLIPAGWFSLLAATLTAYLMIFAQPLGNKAFKQVLLQIARSQANLDLKEQVFNDHFDRLVIYVDQILPQERIMKGIMIADQRNSDTPETIFAAEGFLLPSPDPMSFSLRLKDGAIHRLYEKSRYQLLSFAQYDFTLNFQESLEGKGFNKLRVREMTLSELEQQIESIKRGDQDKKKDYYALLTELYKRLFTPYACLILGLLGAPLGIKNQRSGRSGGFAISLFILIANHLLNIMGESLGEKGAIPPILAFLVPNLILTMTAAYLIYKVGGEKPFTWLERLLEMGSNGWVKTKNVFFRLPEGISKRAKGQGFFRRYGRPIPSPGRLSFWTQRIKTLQRYVLNTFLKLFILTTFAFLSLFLIGEFIGRVGQAVEHQAEFRQVLLYFVYQLPFILFQVAPFALLCSSILLMTILSRNNELIAIQAGGISIHRISRPLLLLSLLASLATLLGGEFLLPYTNHQSNLILQTKIKKRFLKGIYKNSKIWYHGEDHTIWNIQLIYPEGNLMNGVTLFRMGEDSRLKERLDATRARWEGGKGVSFLDGFLRAFDGDGSFQASFFSEKKIPSSEKLEDFMLIQKEPNEMSLREISAYVKKVQSNGYDATQYLVDMHAKLAFPFSCLVMTLVGIPFSLRSSRSGGVALGIVSGIFLGFAYWILSSIDLSLGKAGTLPPLVAAWGANLLFTTLGITLMFYRR